MGHKTRIMYLERKAGNLTGPARIGRVTYSKTGATIYYGGREFRSLKGRVSRPITTMSKLAKSIGFLGRAGMAVMRSMAPTSRLRLTKMSGKNIGPR
jgi:hypothetical protein